MTLIPRQEEKHCFIACSEDKVKSGLCDCINRIQEQALNIRIMKNDEEIREQLADLLRPRR